MGGWFIQVISRHTLLFGQAGAVPWDLNHADFFVSLSANFDLSHALLPLPMILATRLTIVTIMMVTSIN